MFTPEIRARSAKRAPSGRSARTRGGAYPERAHLLGCETGWEMREEIARVVPMYEGVQHLRKTGDAFQYGGPRLCDGGTFPHTRWEGALPRRRVARAQARAGQFHVSTRRGKQFNTLIYAEIDPLNGAPRDAVLINPMTLQKLTSFRATASPSSTAPGRYEASVFLAPIARGNLQVHWPEGNVIIPPRHH
jgi:hypothetical protein